MLQARVTVVARPLPCSVLLSHGAWWRGGSLPTTERGGSRQRLRTPNRTRRECRWQGLGGGGCRDLCGPGHDAPGRGQGSAKAEADLCSSRRGIPWASPRVRGLLLAKRQQEQRGERWGERGGGKVGKAGLAVSAPKEPGHRFTSSGVTEGSEPGRDVVTALCSGRTTSGSTEGSYGWEAAEAKSRERLPHGASKGERD